MKTVLVKSLQEVIPFLFCLVLITSGARATSYTYQTFDAPTAADTYVMGINDSGQASGYWMLVHDQGTPVHGFIRSADGTITTFDNTSAYCSGSGATRTFGINSSGQVAGYCLSGSLRQHHGFVRSANGLTYTPAIDDPNVVNNSSVDASGTSVTGINDSGQVAGYYTVNQDTHGFLTNANHTQFTTIDYPSAIGKTYAYGINNSGQVAGYYNSGPGSHGFVRNADGSFTPFEVPNSSLGLTYAYGINNSGQVVGCYHGADNVYRGFVRSADGLTYSKIDYPLAYATYAYGINNNGQVIGRYRFITGNWHGFIATPVAPTATHFAVNAPATATAGTVFSFTVTALDESNATVTGYPGAVHFTSSDPAAVLPVNATLTNGTGTFAATLKTTGNRTITATDTVTASITGASGNITVTMPVLSISFSGNGSGTVTSTSPDTSINCSKGSSSGCSTSYPLNTSVTLAATGNWKSLFAGWSGGLTSSANPVTFTMDNNMSLTVTINPNYMAKLLPANSLFDCIQDAYASVSSGSITIMAQTGSFLENLTFGNGMTVTLTGGMDSSYNPTSGFSTVYSLTVGNGSAVIGNIILN